MNSLIELYSYMLECNEIKSKIVKSNREDFLEDETGLLIAMGVIDNLIELSAKVDKIILFDEYLSKEFNQMYFIKDYMLNKFGEINGYLVYDFFLLEYDLILNKIKEILAI